MDLRTGISYWRTIESWPMEVRSLEEDVTCDVAVVGDGITEALVGYSLIRAGLDTVLVD